MAAPAVARPLPLTAVRLTGGPLKHAQDLDAAYLLSLVPDRMLAFYRKHAGLEPKDAGYTGWEQRRPAADRPHRRALSLGGQPDVVRHRRRPLQAARRLHRQRNESRSGQERRRLRRRPSRRARRLCRGLEGQHPIGQLRSQRSLVAVVHAPQDVCRTPGRLSPHRQPDGARRRNQVRGVGREVSGADGRHAHSANARHRVRRHERSVGGSLRRHRRQALARSLVQVRAQSRLRTAARGEDPLNGLTATRRCPSSIGLAARYDYAGSEGDGAAARFFWDRVVDHHTFATGGHGKDEYFREPGKLSNITEGRTARPATSTTC